MKYKHYDDLATLAEQKLISVRKHPDLPLFIYNYTAGAQAIPIHAWSDALQDCRGLILDADGVVVGRPFKKFWNYSQVLDQVPVDLLFTVWEKLDGSLGIVCNYRGNLVVATRGSFESDQAKFAERWLNTNVPGWVPVEGLTYLFEILYPENRIVVDYGDTKELRLLAVMEAGGGESLASFYSEDRFPKVRCFAPTQVQIVQDSILVQDDPGKEGYVLRWSNGFRAKVKFEEYCRLHRLITQVSTRSIWGLMRNHQSLDELVDRVPEAFKQWVNDTRVSIAADYANIHTLAYECFKTRPSVETRAEYAAWVKGQVANFGLLFALYDGKPINDKIWKMVEPRWSTPFRKEIDGAEE